MDSLSVDSFHFERPRLNQLFSEAVKYPLVVVCAGAGYGKTSAVHDFVQGYEAATSWIQLSERDNIGTRFWENYSHSMSRISQPFAQAIRKLGFPDTGDKLNQYFALLYDITEVERCIIVMDDVHLIDDRAVLHFMEHDLRVILPGATMILISRSALSMNTAGLISKGQLFNIHQSDLEFTEDELFQYFRQQDITLPPDKRREIMHDTGGWAFALNLIARSYLKAPGYAGYVRDAMKTNIFQLMESEVWNGISERLQLFLMRLSLIGHLSFDLVALLANDDSALIAELERLNAYVYRDTYINAYLIHHLFLEFISSKHDLLSVEHRHETYAIAGDWCHRNGFKIDALAYYEKTKDYPSIISIFYELPIQVPLDIARYAAEIFSHIPPEVFFQVDFLAVMHVRVIISLGQWEKAFELMRHYESLYTQLPADSEFRNHALGCLYYCWGMLRTLLCTIDDKYDFDQYYAKQDECLTRSPLVLDRLTDHPLGPWISLVGTARKGAPQEYIETLARAERHISHCLNGTMAGAGDLARGELLFYQGDVNAAESLMFCALEQARESRQFGIVHRAQFYLLRMAVFQGNYTKAQRALKDMETQLDETEYPNRFITYDIALAWYYYMLCLPEKIPDWLKENFEPYGHAYFIENFGNQAKARYCFLARNFPPLLAYIQELKRREAVLFGRIEMLALEACVQYKLHNSSGAFESLRCAYEAALPNGIVMPFIELGKDMRTLSAAAQKEKKCGISQTWLQNINYKAASYAKRQLHIIAKYKEAHCISEELLLSAREKDILTDLSHGLSRTEIAVSRSLSINTVKMVINNIYSKLGAVNLADLIRIAAERKMI